MYAHKALSEIVAQLLAKQNALKQTSLLHANLYLLFLTTQTRCALNLHSIYQLSYLSRLQVWFEVEFLLPY